MIGVVRADVGNGCCIPGQFVLRHFFDLGFEVFHHSIEPLHDVIPMGGVEVVKGLVVVRGVGRFFSAQAGEDVLVPKDEMISEHADGVIGIGVELALGVVRDPLRLLGREAGDGGVHGGEPFGCVMGSVQLG